MSLTCLWEPRDCSPELAALGPWRAYAGMQTESTPSNGRVSKTTCLKPTPGRVRSVANAFPWPRPRPQQCLKSARRSPLRGRAENPGASCEGVQRRGARPLRVRARRPSLATPLLRPDLVRPGRRLASSAAQLGADFSNLTSGGVAAALALVLALEMERPASGSAELAPAGLPAQQVGEDGARRQVLRRRLVSSSGKPHSASVFSRGQKQREGLGDCSVT